MNAYVCSYRFRRKAPQNFYQGFVHLLCCTLKKFPTASHKQSIPCMGKTGVLRAFKFTQNMSLFTLAVYLI